MPTTIGNEAHYHFLQITDNGSDKFLLKRNTCHD